jgi:hypothetical protein
MSSGLLAFFILKLLSVVEYREAEYTCTALRSVQCRCRDHQTQGFLCHFGLDTAENHRLLDQRTAFEKNCHHIFDQTEGKSIV